MAPDDRTTRGPEPDPPGGARVRLHVPAGHYYSPIPAAAELRPRADEVFAVPDRIPAIDMNTEEQLGILALLAEAYRDLPSWERPDPARRFRFENPMYSYSDAICLYGMMRYLRPRRIIEIGSGYSSAAMLDTDELHLGSSVAFTFIEPYPETLRSLLKPGDAGRIELLASPLQEVDLARFEALEANDILFVDSSHVSKAGSDVNRIVFEILPRLASGVFVHFHDVFYPFEYPAPWILDRGIAWNEAYLIRAFLQYNAAFKIALCNTYLEAWFGAELRAALPLSARNPGGSLWLRKTVPAEPRHRARLRAPGPVSGPPTHGRFSGVPPAAGYFARIEVAGWELHVDGWLAAPLPEGFLEIALYLNQELVGCAPPIPAPSSYDRRKIGGEPQLFQFRAALNGREVPDFSRLEVVGYVAGRPERRLVTRYRSDIDARVPTPPEHLLLRVTGCADATLVKHSGLRAAVEFIDAIEVFRDLGSVRRLLDFGCGPGRVTAQLLDVLATHDGLAVEGCDIDGEAIAWCQEHLPRGRFQRIAPLPPLPYEDGTFDVVVSCSVFTHLDEASQQRWLAELARVLSPGGLLLASVVSRFPDAVVPPRGISDGTLDQALDGIAPPGFYRATCQSREYTLHSWSGSLEVLDFIERGLEGMQDLVVLRHAGSMDRGRR